MCWGIGFEQENMRPAGNLGKICCIFLGVSPIYQEQKPGCLACPINHLSVMAKVNTCAPRGNSIMYLGCLSPVPALLGFQNRVTASTVSQFTGRLAVSLELLLAALRETPQ